MFARNDNTQYSCCNGLYHIVTGARFLLFLQILVIIGEGVATFRLSSSDEFKYSMSALLVVLINVIISATFYYGIEMEKHGYLLPYIITQAILIIISTFTACVLLLFSFIGATEAIQYFVDCGWFPEALCAGVTNDRYAVKVMQADNLIVSGKCFYITAAAMKNDAAATLRLIVGCLVFGIIVQCWFFSIAIKCFRYFLAKRSGGYVGRFHKLHIRESSVVLL